MRSGLASRGRVTSLSSPASDGAAARAELFRGLKEGALLFRVSPEQQRAFVYEFSAEVVDGLVCIYVVSLLLGPRVQSLTREKFEISSRAPLL